jgi:photosystem II stability/assembly factor-like uncharacterized protein
MVLKIPAHRECRRRVAAAALVGGLALLLPGSAFTEAPVVPGHAIPSALAAESPLLDAAHAGSRIVAVGVRGHVVLSDDNGNSWRQAKSVPTRAMLTAVFFADDRQGWAVGHDEVIIHTSDGGEVWELQHSAPENQAPLLSVWFENPSHGLAVGGFSAMLETNDGGKTWSRVSSLGEEEGDLHLNDIFASSNGTIFVAAEIGFIYRSDDNGKSWRELNPPYTGSFWGGLGLRSGALLVFGMRGHAFRSDDLGETWAEIETGTGKSLTGGAQLDDSRVMIVGLGGTILSSEDGGVTFTEAVRRGRRGIYAVVGAADGSIVLFGEKGVELARQN